MYKQISQELDYELLTSFSIQQKWKKKFWVIYDQYARKIDVLKFSLDSDKFVCLLIKIKLKTVKTILNIFSP